MWLWRWRIQPAQTTTNQPTTQRCVYTRKFVGLYNSINQPNFPLPQTFICCCICAVVLFSIHSLYCFVSLPWLYALIVANRIQPLLMSTRSIRVPSMWPNIRQVDSTLHQAVSTNMQRLLSPYFSNICIHIYAFSAPHSLSAVAIVVIIHIMCTKNIH